MGGTHTVEIPVNIIQKLEEVIEELERTISPYKPEFLARMYRARASDLEGKGKTLSDIKCRFKGD